MKTKLVKLFNFSPGTKHVYIKPFALLHALFAVICFLYPIIIFIVAIEDNIYTWPTNIIITLVFLFIISSLTSIWSSFQWWSSYKKTASLSIAENGPISSITISIFLQSLS